MREVDLVVIGAGPGGYTAAFAAADKGMNVVLVEGDDKLGGVCLNRGCIPSKTLLHVARLITETREAANLGISFGSPRIDLAGLRQWKNQVIDKNVAGLQQLAKARGVKVIQAWAHFQDSNTLLLSSQRDGQPDQGVLQFERAVLATGSRPAEIPGLPLDSPRVMNSTIALDLLDVPESLLVIGGGYIGLELATVYAALGSSVTIVEMTDGLLPGVDRDLVGILQNRLRRTFKAINLNTKVVKMEDTGEAVSVTFDSAAPQLFNRVLIAVGRTPNSDRIGLENTRVKLTSQGFVEINEKQQTADENIYTIGDVAGEPMLAHKAAHEAKVAVADIAGEQAISNPQVIPAVVFTDPELAWAGLSETQAKQLGKEIEVSKFPWSASGRAASIGRNDGLTKLIVEPGSKRILGIGIVGVGAGELIAEGVLAIEKGVSAYDLAKCIHPHPTLSETIGQAAELAFGTTVNIFHRPR